MTPLEHRNLELTAQVLAYRMAMQWSASALGLSLKPLEPSVRLAALTAIEQKVANSQSDYQDMTFPERSAAESDLWAGLIQESFEAVSKEFLKIVRQAAS